GRHWPDLRGRPIGHGADCDRPDCLWHLCASATRLGLPRYRLATRRSHCEGLLPEADWQVATWKRADLVLHHTAKRFYQSKVNFAIVCTGLLRAVISDL